MNVASTELETAPEAVAPPEPAARKQTRPATNTKPKPQPPYAVILHNDPINGFEYVIGVLRKVFRYGGMRAFVLTLRAHLTGRSAVWIGPLEVAELKADQIRSAGPDPKKIKSGAGPLGVSIEPIPG
jgi:ATP-dependent Clp protease adaptor protein ClpS